MNRILSIFIVASMLMSSLGIQASAESLTSQIRYSDFKIVEATDVQKRLTYMEDTTRILDVDGLKFKDLDKDGELDVYEDWRLDDETRAADLVEKLPLKQKVGLLFMGNVNGRPDDLDPYSFTLTEDNRDYQYMTEFGLTNFLDNANGTPVQQVVHHNALQAYGEATAFGIPITLASDREYNTWGGMVDAMHAAYGTAHDADLVAEIVSMQAKEIKALKYQVVFHPSAVELGDSYGETPSYVAEVVGKEVNALVTNGVEATAKHFIAKAFTSSASPAESLENWIIPWKSAIENGVGWIMTNNQGLGLSGSVLTDFDSVTLNFLRNDLGYNGIIITDWGSFGSHSAAGRASGVTPEGVNLDDYALDAEMLYSVMLNAGVDMFGSSTLQHGTTMESSGAPNMPEALIAAVEHGTCDEALVDRSAKRVLVSKFRTGMFEDPYADADAVMLLAADPAYLANPWDIVDNATLSAARNQELVALEEKLEAESAVLLKNDNDLLPLATDQKVYLTGTNSLVADMYKVNMANIGFTLVDTLEEADVAIVDINVINDASELYIEDAVEAEKPLSVILEAVEADAWTIMNADAVLYDAAKRTPDHGNAMSNNFSNYMDPWIMAGLIKGDYQPEGKLVKEVARTVEQDTEDWGDVANDFGANEYVRMILAALQLEDPNQVPENYGNPLFCNGYGMRYGEAPDFEYRALTVPVQYERTEKVTDYGQFVYRQVFIDTFHTVKAGQPFDVYCILFNHGADGVETVELKDGDEVLATDVFAVNGGSWRIVTFQITLDEIGEHTLNIAGMEENVTVVE